MFSFNKILLHIYRYCSTRVLWELDEFRYSILDGASGSKFEEVAARFYAAHVKRLVDVLIKVCFGLF